MNTQKIIKNIIYIDKYSNNIIRKLPGKNLWRLYSRETHRNLGTFPSIKAAKNHEREIEFFKHRGYK